MVIEFGLSISESSTKISKYYAPTDSEYQFHKVGIKNWLAIAFEQGVP